MGERGRQKWRKSINLLESKGSQIGLAMPPLALSDTHTYPSTRPSQHTLWAGTWSSGGREATCPGMRLKRLIQRCKMAAWLRLSLLRSG